MEISELENTIMQCLLADLPPALEVLHSQYANANVIERDFTGVGFFTSFGIPDSVDRIVSKGIQLEAFLTLQDVPFGASVILDSVPDFL